MAMCVMRVVALAPCQCFWRRGFGPRPPFESPAPGYPLLHPSRPLSDNRVWPSGCECQAVRALGSNVTRAPAARDGSAAENSGSMRHAPVKDPAFPWFDGSEPPWEIVML